MSAPGQPDVDPRASLGERIIRSLPGLTRFVRRSMGPELASRESATDIVQSTCRELLRGASGFEDRGEAGFQSWIRSAAVHKLQNRARHWNAARRAGDEVALDGSESRAELLEPASPAAHEPSQEALLREEAERLRRAFDSLPAEYRHVIVRFQVDGASQAEIARELGRTSEAVRKLVARAMSRLSAELEEGGAQPPRSERAGRKPVE
jgi:RNA polymerase sigma factor (sigma-70 family)